MWIVRLALRQPYTIAVMSFVLMLMGWLAMRSMPVDIFPVIDIPVVAVVWNYNGFSAQDMESRIVLLSERNLSATVNGISRIESESIPGVGLIKIFFQPGVDIGNAIAQITSSSQTALRAMPPGVTPPYVVQSNASSVPVAQITMTSRSLPEQDISDYGQNFIRLQLFTIPGLATPSPYGGKLREITVNVDPKSLGGKGLSAEDVLSALLSSNLLIPAGTARIGDRDYNVAMNSSPSNVADFNNIPIKVVNGAPVLIGDVATVRDGFAEQENIVRIDGRRAAYLTILKKADASTLAVVDAAKDMLPRIRAVAPAGLRGPPRFRSVGVRPRSRDQCRPRGGDRRGPRFAHDSAVRRKLAQCTHRRHIDPALDRRRGHRPPRDRQQLQRHDARRPVPVDRSARRQRDRHRRERPPQHWSR